MNDRVNNDQAPLLFYQRPQVKKEIIPVGKGIPFGVESIWQPRLGIGGAYGSWGESFDNAGLLKYIEQRFGTPVKEEEKLNLSPLGFIGRQHTPELSPQEHVNLEVEVGIRFLGAAIKACGWKPEEVDGVLIGMSSPVADDYVERIAAEAGIPQGALKVSVHKACDGSMGALQLALNPDLQENQELGVNIARELAGKKVLVGGIEGLSRFVFQSHDMQALQLFGNGAGVIGLVPGESMQFLVGRTHEVYDKDGVLAVHMNYPYSKSPVEGQSRLEVTQQENLIRVAGMMHEPETGESIDMAGPMGMVKLFVRNGVDVVKDVYQAYQNLMEETGRATEKIKVAIVHHANLKINQLKQKTLVKEGVPLSMPWLISDFGNVSAASNMIAFLRSLPDLLPGDHIILDGFGAGTYYDVMAVVMGGKSAS
jgi:3-oxoacyl-[acyl-carrier-protein] synthase III